MQKQEDVTIDSPIDNSINLVEQKAKQKIKNKSYQTITGTFNHLNNQRKIKVHRNQIEKMQNFNNDLSHSNPTTNNDYKIAKLNSNRNDLLEQREDLLNKNPNLNTSLGHIEVQRDLERSAALQNNQKKRNRKTIQNKSIPHYKVTKNNINANRSSNNIELKDEHIRVQSSSDIRLDKNKFENAKNKTTSNKEQKYLKNISIRKNDDKYKLENTDDTVKTNIKNKNHLKGTTPKKDKNNSVKKAQRKKKDRQKIKKRSMFGSPLTSSSVGHRTKTQKVALAPSKAVSSIGGSIKGNFNKEIEENEMTEGVQFANAVVSPLSRKLRFETNNLVAKTVGFDRKAYKLGKIEKKIMKTDKKAYKAKKAQRKAIRKRAERKARASIMARKTSNKGIIARGRAMASQSWKQIKDKVRKVVQAIIAKIATSKALIAGSGLLLVAIIPVVVFLPIMMLTGGSALSSAEEEQSLIFSVGSLSPDVLQHEETVVEELQKHGLEEYKDLVLVLIHLESRGALPDVMQSSESIGLPPNSITDPKRSIEVGVNHLAKGIEQMNRYGVDIQTLIQAYNFGNGFIPFVASNGGTWTQRLSDEFTIQQANRLGWDSYGDPDYVSKAMQHLSVEGNTVTISGSFDLEGGNLSHPTPNALITSHFGWRIHPIEKTRKLHTGTDFGAPYGTPIFASADGVVIEAGRKGGYGLTVVIDHGSGVQTLYAHNQKLLVKAGQTVKVGEQIAEMGSTGSSTGSHLHFEVRVNGEYHDPINWLQ